ncbi:MAG: helix-turn-helix domain-containing protein [Prevotella sp.]|nr:helix-turn-helix domain-containing protein [Prevotella sp.]
MKRQDARMIAEELFAIMEKEQVFDDKYIGASEAAEMLGIPLSTLYNQIADIPHAKVGKYLRFSKRELRKYINKK